MTDAVAKPFTHRYTFAGSLDTMGDARSLNATWTKIAAAFEALEKIVIDEGGTLTCTPQRIGTKKAERPGVPVVPPAPDAAHLGTGPVVYDGAAQAANEAPQGPPGNAPPLGKYGDRHGRAVA